MALMDQLTQLITSQAASQAAPKAGLNEDMMKKMMPMATALIMSKLGKNAQDPAKANAINAALDRHDGSLLRNPAQLADDSVMNDGMKMLGHIFGGQQGKAEQSLAQLGGIDASQAKNMLAMVAPMVMGALGQQKQQQSGFNASMLTDMLGQERQQAQRAMPNELGGVFKMLDADGDGDFKDDLAGIGMKMLGGMFGRK